MFFELGFQRAALGAALLLCAGVALAQEPAVIKPVAAHAFSSATKVDDGELKAIAGKADLSQTVLANNTSTVSGNSVNGLSTTGTVNFGTDAFSQVHGLALVSANTGNNVSINSSLNVTIALQH